MPKTRLPDSPGMDVLRVEYWDAWKPDLLVEGFSSVIWTERFQEPGDFELKTPFVKDVSNALPVDSFITLRDSKELMIVENHKYGRDSEGAPELTLTGRTLDCMLEHRTITHLFDYYGKSVKMVRNYTLNEMVETIVWNSMVNRTGVNVLHDAQPKAAGSFLSAEPDETAFWDTCVSDTTPSPVPGERKRRWIKEEQAGDRILRLMVRANLGIRCIRPPSAGRKVSIWSGTNTKGEYHLVEWADIPDLRLDVYNGRDRRAGQTENEPVIYTYSAGDLMDPEYILSTQQYKTVAQVRSSVGSKYVVTSDWNSGINHREILVDGGSPAENENFNDFWADLVDVGEEALKNANRSKEIFTTGIAPTAAYEYSKDYNLGDKVTVIGEHGFRRTMVVNEYTRTLDAEGERGFPGLVLPWEI